MIDPNDVPPMDDEQDTHQDSSDYIPPTVVRDSGRAWVDVPLDSPLAMRLRRFGAHWDPDSKQWWVGIAKATGL
ncbi:hypothetical protein, partial [Mycobacterium sp.]|uniref:hypothetical protein n=1 Tax=Mycobacterium sp. TaxID=1785 RepID=UPI003F9C6AAC